jgi:hypothetical protein
VGQTKSETRYKARQKEHARKNKQALYDYTELGNAKPGIDLDILEQSMINKHGGILREGGILKNKRHQIRRSRWDKYRIK